MEVSTMALLHLLLVLSFCILCHGVDARSHSQQERLQRFSRSQELDSMFIIREDEFDCVDIYKQPAFKHPLLKNHKIELNPNFKRVTRQSRSLNIGKAFTNETFNRGCPPGKVPIYREKTSSNSFESQLGNFSQFSEQFPMKHLVTLDTNQNATYSGGHADINACHPKLQFMEQYSLGQIIVQGGPPGEVNFVQAGWGVVPAIYRDEALRLTGNWRVQGSSRAGCFNAMCPGFVQIHHTIYFGIILKSSPPGSDTKSRYTFQITQQPQSGNWWLLVQGEEIGYWPKQLFTHMDNGASLVRFGGETYTQFDMLSPPMGTGYFPQAKLRYSCFFAQLQIVDSQLNIHDIKPEDMTIYRDASRDCYDMWYGGDQGKGYKQAFLFGGPGGDCGI